MTVYVYGCATCGINGSYVNKIKKYADINGRVLDIKNSKHDKQALKEHVIKLEEAGLGAETYQPIIVDGNKIVRIREWNL